MRPPSRELVENKDLMLGWLSDLWKLLELCSCKIKVGNYTGDGSEDLEVDVDFAIKYLGIWVRPTAAGDAFFFEKADDSWGTLCVKHLSWAGGSQHVVVDDAIISFAGTTFHVDDAAGDNHPNKNGTVYTYMALG